MKIKFWEENYCFKEYNIYQNSIYSKILIFSKVGGFQWGLTVPPAPKKKKPRRPNQIPLLSPAEMVDCTFEIHLG